MSTVTVTVAHLILLVALVCMLICLARGAESSSSTAAESKSNCNWKKREVQPEVIYINLAKSKDRREQMELFMKKYGHVYYRVDAVMPRDIYTPEDLKYVWNTPACKDLTDWVPPVSDATDFDSIFIQSNYAKKIYVRGLCGSASNSWKELATTISHLLAIRQAVYSKTATSRYALIVEDDVWSPFDVDFEELADSTNEEFGILQLFNSKPIPLFENFEHYKKDNSYLWVKRPPAFDGRYLPTWSTGAYLINRMVMKSVIDSILTVDKNGWHGFRVLAGSTHPVCKPTYCCMPNSSNFVEPTRPPCAYAPIGYQADSFVYSTGITYTLSLPLFVSNSQSDNSTLHQAHVSTHHRSAFKRINQFVNELYSGLVNLPKFVRPSCEGFK